MSEHRYDIRISEAVLIRIRKGSKDRTQTTFPVCRLGKGAHWKLPHMSLNKLKICFPSESHKNITKSKQSRKFFVPPVKFTKVHIRGFVFLRRYVMVQQNKG